MGIFSISFQTPPSDHHGSLENFFIILANIPLVFMTGMCEWKHLSPDNSDEKMYKHFMRQLLQLFTSSSESRSRVSPSFV